MTYLRFFNWLVLYHVPQMFQLTGSFIRNAGGWDFSNVVSMVGMFLWPFLSTKRRILIGLVDGSGCIETDDPSMEPLNLCQGCAPELGLVCIRG
jgi:hypothetical protein